MLCSSVDEANESMFPFSEVGAAQRTLVVLLVLCLFLALQPFLRAFRPFGWCGAVHCAVLYFFNLWQDVPNLIVAKRRAKYREHAHLLLGLLGSAFCVWHHTAENDVLLALVQLFVLPVLSTWEVNNMEYAGAPSHVYLVVHCAVTCGQFHDSFRDKGWQYCIVSVIFDGLLFSMIHGKIRAKKKLMDHTCGTIKLLLNTLCDGCCILSGAGTIVMSDTKVAILLGAGAAEGWELDGLPFGALLAPGVTKEEDTGPKEGTKVTSLMTGSGCRITVETHTIRCSLPPEGIQIIMGRTLEGAEGNMASGSDFFFCAIRCRDAPMEAAGRQRNRERRKKLSEFSLNGLQDNDEVSSDLSSNACSLVNRRLQLLGKMPVQSNYVRDVPFQSGTPIILELDLPCSDLPGSEAHGAASDIGSTVSARGRAKMRLGRRSSCDSVVGSETGAGAAAGNAPEDGDEEVVSTEIKSVGLGAEGHMRVQVGFRSQMLFQQSMLLDTVSTELQSAKREMRVRDDVQKEEKELLRKFQKIVTRDISGEEHNVRVFIFMEEEAQCEELTQTCKALGYSCQAFSDLPMGRVALEASSGSGFLDSSSNWILTRPEWTPAVSSSSEAAAHTAQEGAPEVAGKSHFTEGFMPTHLVLVGASMLEQLPSEWCNADLPFFVALIGNQEEYDCVNRVLSGSSEEEKRERLRTYGVSESVMQPVTHTSIQRLVGEAVRQRIGHDYLLVQMIGKGATCVVYSAKRLRDGKVFAMKDINIARFYRRHVNQNDTDRLWKEAEVLKSLKWPTTISIMDAWLAGGKQVYMLMPVMDGGTISDMVASVVKTGTGDAPRQNDRYTLDQAGEWYAQTLHGMAYIHWCGLLHRDIKSENLLLTANGRSLRIADFGSIQYLPGKGPHPARRNSVRGSVTTANITGPEVFARGTCYPASDLWSVGATFYEVYTLTPLLPPCKTNEWYADVIGTLNLDEILQRFARSTDPQRLPQEVVSDLSELLEQDPMKRPMAATLMMRPRTYRHLSTVLSQSTFSEEPHHCTGHAKAILQLCAESAAAADLDPPEEALGAVPVS